MVQSESAIVKLSLGCLVAVFLASLLPYSSAQYTNVCTGCDPGSFAYRCSLYINNRTAIYCEAGFCFTAEMCTSCRPGSYAPFQNMTTCIPCPFGTYNSLPRQAQCQRCPLGQQPNTDRTSCTACPVGTYSADGTYCKQCPWGTYADVSGLSVCKKCAAGYYAAQYGMTACTLCEGDKVAPDEGTDTCYTCPDLWTADVNHHECVPSAVLVLLIIGGSIAMFALVVGVITIVRNRQDAKWVRRQEEERSILVVSVHNANLDETGVFDAEVPAYEGM